MKNCTLYHVSRHQLDKIILYPRIPEGNGYDENTTIKRICFSTSIQGCLNSIKNKIFINDILHIYTLNYNKNLKYKIPNVTDVYDVKITNEVWVLNKCSVTLQKRIKIINEVNTKTCYFYCTGIKCQKTYNSSNTNIKKDKDTLIWKLDTGVKFTYINL